MLGTTGVVAKLLAIPAFIAAVMATRTVGNRLGDGGSAPVPILFAVQVALLALFAGLAVGLGPFPDGDTPQAILTGLVGVAAMAVQTGTQRAYLGSDPPSTILTSTTTQFRSISPTGWHGGPPWLSAAQRQQFAALGRAIACFGGARCWGRRAGYFVGLWCLVLPVVIAAVVAIRVRALPAGDGAAMTLASLHGHDFLRRRANTAIPSAPCSHQLPSRAHDRRIDTARPGSGGARPLCPDTGAGLCDAVLRGHVTVDGRPATRPALAVRAEAALAIDDPASGYVSRAALKLIAGLDHFGYPGRGGGSRSISAPPPAASPKCCSSAAPRASMPSMSATASWRRGSPAITRVVAREGLNARDLAPDDLGEAPDAIVSDVSFISLRLALPPALALAASGCWGIFLVKPQFEVGRDGIGKGGIVRDPAEAEKAAAGIADWLGGVAGLAGRRLVPVADRRWRRQP